MTRRRRRAAGTVRLVFQVPDVDAERERLIAKGLEIGPPVENTREGYREIRLARPGRDAHDPVFLVRALAHELTRIAES